MLPEAEPVETLRFVYKFKKINLAGGQHSWVTAHCYILSRHRFCNVVLRDFGA